MITSRDKTYAAAQKFQQKGQLDKAIAELERLVEEDPTDVRTLLKIGDLHVRRQDTPAAIATYTQVAQAYRDEGFFLKAVAVYKQVVHLDPENAASAQDLAALYEQLGLVSDAVQQYRALLALHRAKQAWPAAIGVLQKLLALEGETQELLLHWAEAHTRIDDVPEVKRTLTRVAEACRAQNREEDWARVAEQLLSVDPDLAGLACELARHYMGRDEPKQALLKLQLAFRAAPQDTETLTLLAQVFEALGQQAKAIAVLHELAGQAQQRSQSIALERIVAHIRKLDPDDAQLQTYAPAKAERSPGTAGKLTQLKGDGLPTLPATASRIAAPDSTQNLTPANAPAAAAPIDLSNLLIEASVFARYGLRGKALEYLNRVLTAFPEHAGARAQHAALSAELHASAAKNRSELGTLVGEAQPAALNVADAAQSLDHHFDTYLVHAAQGLPQPGAVQAGRSNDSDYETHLNLGIAYREMGLYKDAIGQFDKASASADFAVNATMLIGLSRIDLGQDEAGIQALEAALALPQTTDLQRVAILYELGNHAHAHGRAQVASQAFAAAFALDPTFRDLAQRVTPG